MVLVNGTNKLLSLEARGRFGYTAGVGLLRCGYSRCGSSALYGGIYSRKKTATGHALSRMRYYRPTNPQTAPQQAWRSTFATAISGYQALTADEKLALNKEARRYRLSGLTLYVRRYLQAHRA